MLSISVKNGAIRHCTELLKNKVQNRQTLACPWETSEMLKLELLPDARNRCSAAESKTEPHGTVRSGSKNQGSESPNFRLFLGDKRNVETGSAARSTKSMLGSRVKSGALEQKARFRIANRTAQPALPLASQMMHGQLVSINKHTIRINLF